MAETPKLPARIVAPIHFEDFDGRQFERLVFAYHLRTDTWQSLEWYGQTGSDSGRDIWGVRERGDSVCIQCANRHRLVATKAIDDLNKIVRARSGIPGSFLVVCASSVSAKVRDSVKEHAMSLGVAHCEIWAGHEFEERLRQKAEGLLRRFMEGVVFPDDPAALRDFAASERVDGNAKQVHGLRLVDGAEQHRSTQSIRVVESNNFGIIANQVTIRGRSRPGAIIIPGTIGSDPQLYNYVEYLIKRLTEFRDVGKSYGQQRGGRVHPGATRKILEKQLGGLPKDLPVDRFPEIVMHLMEKIDNTAQGRRNRARNVVNYHRFEDHPGSTK
jgi:hypothetical protein